MNRYGTNQTIVDSKSTERPKRCTHKSFYYGCWENVAPGSDKFCVKHFNERLARFGIEAVGK